MQPEESKNVTTSPVGSEVSEEQTSAESEDLGLTELTDTEPEESAEEPAKVEPKEPTQARARRTVETSEKKRIREPASVDEAKQNRHVEEEREVPTANPAELKRLTGERRTVQSPKKIRVWSPALVAMEEEEEEEEEEPKKNRHKEESAESTADPTETDQPTGNKPEEITGQAPVVEEEEPKKKKKKGASSEVIFMATHVWGKIWRSTPHRVVLVFSVPWPCLPPCLLTNVIVLLSDSH